VAVPPILPRSIFRTTSSAVGALELLTPDSDNLKAAASYLLEVTRSSEGRRYCKQQPKMDALREYKGEILEASSGPLARL
jgi:hypothetical protein